jgi:hypothetical protein
MFVRFAFLLIMRMIGTMSEVVGIKWGFLSVPTVNLSNIMFRSTT